MNYEQFNQFIDELHQLNKNLSTSLENKKDVESNSHIKNNPIGFKPNISIHIDHKERS